jgi:hypothetical protein
MKKKLNNSESSFIFNIDTSSILSEGDLENKEFELITTAKQTDPRYGNFSFPKSELQDMTENFNKNVLGIEIAVDINHDFDKKAYAWITPGSMIVKESSKLDGQFSIYAKLYKFTPEGEKLLREGSYRYFSLEIRHRVERFIGGAKKTFKNVISGLAMTNSPVVKDMAPTFSEKTDKNNLFFNSIYNMDILNTLLSELNAKEIVTKAEKDLLNKAFSTLSEDDQGPKKEEVEAVNAKPEQSEEEVKAEAEAKEKAEADEKAKAEAAKEKELSEKNLSQVVTEKLALEKKLASMEAERKEEKVLSCISEVTLSDNVGTGFVKKDLETVKEFALSLSEEQATQFFSIIKEVKTVDLSEVGSSDDAEPDADKEKAADEKAKELSEKEGISYGDALKRVL